MISRLKYYYNELIVLRRFHEIYQQCRCKHDRAYIYDRLIGSKGVRCGLCVSIFIHVCTCSDICKNQHSTSQLPQNISCFFLNKIVWIFLACQMKLMFISSCCPWNVRFLFLIFNERCFINKKFITVLLKTKT